MVDTPSVDHIDGLSRDELLRLMPLVDEAERRVVRENLETYSLWVAPQEPPARHHKLIMAELQALERSGHGRLMIFAPPGSAKSLTASVKFPSWYLGRHPQHDMICASHTASLAEMFGRRVRNTLADEEFSRTFGTSVSKDNAAVGSWSTSAGGRFHAVGVGGSPSGRRADILVMDDLVPNREQADSINYHDKCWEWWQSDIRTRLKPKSIAVLIMTRWSPDDIAGRLLDDMKTGGEQWKVISLPMEAEADDMLGREPGELLWPEWFTPDMVRIAKRDARGWSALYQQRPVPDSGDYFKREWIQWYDDRPERMNVYGASDYAVTAEGDYTVHMVAGVDEKDDLYLLDVWRGKEHTDVWVEQLLALIRQWKPVEWAEESGQIEKSVGPFIDKRMQETKTYCYRRQFPSSKDKPTRAQSIRGRLAQGKVYFPRSRPWVADLVSEMMEFPVGKHDDMCLIEGTLIAMSDGTSKPIEQISVGDSVLTPFGGRLVTAARMTNPAAKVLRITLKNGAELIGTANHPVATERGFVRLDALQCGGSILYKGEPSWMLRLLSSMGVHTADTRKANTSTLGAIFNSPQAVDFSIAISGNRFMGRFLMECTSIMQTAIHWTTGLKTWNASLQKSISQNIQWLANFCKNNFATYPRYGLLLSSGINPKKAESGTENTAKKFGKIKSLPKSPAFAAEQRQRNTTLTKQDSAMQTAGKIIENVALMQRMPTPRKPNLFACAVGLLRGNRTPQRKYIVPLAAKTIIKKEALMRTSPVYNLTVQDAHVYYANGVLCHNCDTLGLFGRILDDTRRPVKPKSAEPTRWLQNLTINEIIRRKTRARMEKEW